MEDMWMNTRRSRLRTAADAKGFTLAEMLTVLAIIILLSTIAVVSTGPFLTRNRIRYAARQAQAAILQARSYATATNGRAARMLNCLKTLCIVLRRTVGSHGSLFWIHSCVLELFSFCPGVLADRSSGIILISPPASSMPHRNVFAASAGRTAGLKAARLAGLCGKNTLGTGEHA